MCKLVVYTVHFRARKSRQKQQKETDLETPHYGSKYGVDWELGERRQGGWLADS